MESYTKGLKEGKESVVKEEGEVASHLEAEMRKMWVLLETRGTKVSTALVIKTLEIREEEVEDMEKVQEEEAFMVPIFISMKKVIVSLNALNDEEGQIGEMMVKQALLMWMRMHNHRIHRMQKEERF